MLPKFRFKNAEETLTGQVCVELFGGRVFETGCTPWITCFRLKNSTFSIVNTQTFNVENQSGPVVVMIREQASPIFCLEDPGSNLRSSTYFLYFLLSFVCFLKLRELHLFEVRLTDFYNFFLHGHSCSQESRCKLQRMKIGFHQNALFTISLQTQVSLR